MQSSRCGLELVIYYISKLAHIKLLALRFFFFKLGSKKFGGCD